MMNRFARLFVTVLSLALPMMASAAVWVQDPTACPTAYQSQDCGANTYACSYSDSTLYCDSAAAITAAIPAADGVGAAIPGGLNGGYVFDCVANSGSTCSTMETTGWKCESNSDCTADFRDTICDGDATTFSCSTSCQSGRLDCEGDATVGACDVVQNSTNYPTGANNHYGATCAAADVVCDTNYLDCDATGEEVGNGCEIRTNYTFATNWQYTGCNGSVGAKQCVAGYLDCDASGTNVPTDDTCEIQIGAACTTGGGLPGVYDSVCQGAGVDPVCLPNKSNFETGTESGYSTSDPLLWGTQYGDGDLINFKKNGGNSFVVDNDANVGIGTDTPAAKLDVAGTFKLLTGATVNDIEETLTSSTTSIPTSAAVAAAITAGSDTDWVESSGDIYRATGNVGIGTTTPGYSYKLDIDDATSANTTARIKGGIANDYVNAGLLLESGHTQGIRGLGTFMYQPVSDVEWYAGTPYQTSDSFIIARQAGAGHSTDIAQNTNALFKIDNAGNVGIGTTTPSDKLSVSGNISATGSISSGGTVYGGNFKPYAVSSDWVGQLRDSSYNFAFKNTAGTEVLTILDDGNVGIGTATPTNPLHLYSSDTERFSVGTTGAMSNYISGAGASQVWKTYMKNANVDGLAGSWDFYTNSDVSPDFFGKIGFKFEGGTADANKQFQIGVANSAAKFVVTGGGNVGIGTTTPGEKLHIVGSEPSSYVAGKIENTGLNGAADFDYANDAQTWKMGVNTLDDFRIRDHTNSNNVLIIEDGSPANSVYVQATTGNVGIGTTTPTSKLDVSGDIHLADMTAPATTTNKLYSVGGALTWDGESVVTGDISSNAITQGDSSVTVTDTGTDGAITFATDGATGMTIDNAGNVGIGTASPGAKLEINDTTNATLIIKSTDNIGSIGQEYGAIKFMASDASAPGAGVKGAIRSVVEGTISGGPSALTFSTSSPASNDVERMRIDNAGNVGIGTTTPNYLLEISKSAASAVGPQLVLTNSANAVTDQSEILFKSGTNVRSIIRSTVDPNPYYGTLSFLTGIGATQVERLTISGNSGNVGIGTTTPSFNLEVGTNNAQFAVTDDHSSTRGWKIEASQDNIFQSWDDADNLFFGVNPLLANTGQTTTHMAIMGASGNVGIGNIAPGEKLDVTGNIAVTGTVDGVDVSELNNSVDTNTTAIGTKADKVIGATTGNIAGLDATGNLTDSGLALNDLGSSTTDLWSASKIGTAIGAAGTLQAVTDSGAMTTNAITTAGLTVDTDTLHVDATNNYVGIGTTTPNSNFHIKAANPIFNIESSNFGNRLQQGILSTGNAFSWLSAGKYQWLDTTGNTALMQLDATTGNMGIGTAAPVARLQVQGKAIETAGTTLFGVYSDGTLGAGGSIFKAVTSDNKGLRVTEAGAISLLTPTVNFSGAGNSLLSFTGVGNSHEFRSANSTQDVTDWTFNAGKLTGARTDGNLFAIANNDAKKFVVDYAGNVGIGTDAPGEILDVAGNIAVTGTVDGVDVSTLSASVTTNTSGIATNAANIATNVTGIATNVTDIATNAGNIAVNTGVLSGKADMVTGATAGNLAGLDGDGNLTDSGLVLNDSGSSTADLWSANKIAAELLSATDTDWVESGGNVYRETGNVGIGTTTPDYKLQVDGDIVPETNIASALGTAALKWGGLFSASIVDDGNDVEFNNEIIVERSGTAADASSSNQTILGVTDTTAARVITLATADVVDGRIIIIKDESGGASTNNITIVTEGSETIDGTASIAITVDYGVLRLYSNGTHWFSF